MLCAHKTFFQIKRDIENCLFLREFPELPFTDFTEYIGIYKKQYELSTMLQQVERKRNTNII